MDDFDKFLHNTNIGSFLVQVSHLFLSWNSRTFLVYLPFFPWASKHEFYVFISSGQLLQSSHCFYRQIPWFFLSFHQDIVQKTYLFFSKNGLSDITNLVYANTASLGAISWQLLAKTGFTFLKKNFLRLKALKVVLKKKFPDLNFPPWFWLKTLFSPDFPEWKKF